MDIFFFSNSSKTELITDPATIHQNKQAIIPMPP
jgi:hypothetical protein